MRVIIAGSDREAVESATSFLKKILDAQGRLDVCVLPIGDQEVGFRYQKGEIALLLGASKELAKEATEEKIKAYKRFLRNLPVKAALVIAPGKDPVLRRAARGFPYTFRWVVPEKPWPGLAALSLEATMAARVAHEIGISSEAIKKAVR